MPAEEIAGSRKRRAGGLDTAAERGDKGGAGDDKDTECGNLGSGKGAAGHEFGQIIKGLYESRLKYERDRIGQLEYAKDQGKAQGLQLGAEKEKRELSALYRRLKEQNRLDEYERAIEDTAFRGRLLREFAVSGEGDKEKNAVKIEGRNALFFY